MDITPQIPSKRLLITGYGAGGFKLNGEAHKGALIICGDQAVQWQAQMPFHFTDADISSLFSVAKEVDILLIGSGKSIQPLLPHLRTTLRENGMSVDVMDTGAACRTYNVLAAEGRRVAAMMLAVE